MQYCLASTIHQDFHFHFALCNRCAAWQLVKISSLYIYICLVDRLMGRVFRITLEGSVYSCKHCLTHLALLDDIISKESAHEKTQKYKEGKFILERFQVLGPDGSNYMVSHEAMVSGSDADNSSM
ncbi:hypothetical protein V6N13_097151 [Hibiscus sabdariffa]